MITKIRCFIVSIVNFMAVQPVYSLCFLYVGINLGSWSFQNIKSSFSGQHKNVCWLSAFCVAVEIGAWRWRLLRLVSRGVTDFLLLLSLDAVYFQCPPQGFSWKPLCPNLHWQAGTFWVDSSPEAGTYTVSCNFPLPTGRQLQQKDVLCHSGPDL